MELNFKKIMLIRKSRYLYCAKYNAERKRFRLHIMKWDGGHREEFMAFGDMLMRDYFQFGDNSYDVKELLSFFSWNLAAEISNLHEQYLFDIFGNDYKKALAYIEPFVLYGKL